MFPESIRNHYCHALLHDGHARLMTRPVKTAAAVSSAQEMVDFGREFVRTLK